MHACAENDVGPFVHVGEGNGAVGIGSGGDGQQRDFVPAQSLAQRLTTVIHRLCVDRLLRI